MSHKAIHPEYKSVKTSFSHIGGKYGRMLMEHFYISGWIKKDGGEEQHFQVTPKGRKEFSKMGIDMTHLEEEE